MIPAARPAHSPQPTVAVQIYFVLVVAAIAAALRFVEVRGDHHWHLLWLPAVDWVVMLAAVIPVYRAACVIAETVVWVFEGIATCMELDNFHYVLFGITPALRCAAPVHPSPCTCPACCCCYYCERGV